MWNYPLQPFLDKLCRSLVLNPRPSSGGVSEDRYAAGNLQGPHVGPADNAMSARTGEGGA